jgi:hypothetical protein
MHEGMQAVPMAHHISATSITSVLLSGTLHVN